MRTTGSPSIRATVIAVLAAVLTSAAAHAQTTSAGQGPRAPSDAAASARDAIGPIRMPTVRELEAARTALPKRDDLDRAVRDQQRGEPIRVPEMPAGSAASAVPDLSRLADQYEQIRRGPAQAPSNEVREASGLRVFVSLGMPQASLRRAVADVGRAGGMLVLRGVMDRSLERTKNLIADLMTEHQVRWQIDPALFKRFEVQAVPAVVLIDPARPVLVDCASNRCQGAAYAKVSGDVTLSHALDTIASQDPAFAGIARQISGSLARGGAR